MNGATASRDSKVKDETPTDADSWPACQILPISSRLKKKKVHFTPFILVDIFLIKVFNKRANKQHVKQYNSARATKRAKQDEK